MKVMIDRKVFKAKLDIMAALTSGLVGDSGDVVMTVKDNGVVTLEAGSDGKYVKSRIGKSAVGDGFEPGEVVFSVNVMKSLYAAGDVVELESKDDNNINFSCGKLKGHVAILDPSIAESIRAEIPKDRPESSHTINVQDLAYVINAVNFTPAVHNSENDIFLSFEKGLIKGVMNDSTRGAICVKSTSNRSVFKLALPPSILVILLNQLVSSDAAHLSVLRDKNGAVLFAESASKDLLIVHPLSVNDEPDESVEGLIKDIQATKKQVSFKANIGDTTDACKAVVSVVQGGMDVDAKLEIKLSDKGSNVVMSSSVGKMKHDFPITRLGKTTKANVYVSGMYYAEIVRLMGQKEHNYRVDIYDSICIMSLLDLSADLGEVQQYIMPLIEQ